MFKRKSINTEKFVDFINNFKEEACKNYELVYQMHTYLNGMAEALWE